MRNSREVLRDCSLDTVEVEKDDIIILSSDGLWNVLQADQLQQIVQRNSHGVGASSCEGTNPYDACVSRTFKISLMICSAKRSKVRDRSYLSAMSFSLHPSRLHRQRSRRYLGYCLSCCRGKQLIERRNLCLIVQTRLFVLLVVPIGIVIAAFCWRKESSRVCVFIRRKEKSENEYSLVDGTNPWDDGGLAEVGEGEVVESFPSLDCCDLDASLSILDDCRSAMSFSR